MREPLWNIGFQGTSLNTPLEPKNPSLDALKKVGGTTWLSSLHFFPRAHSSESGMTFLACDFSHRGETQRVSLGLPFATLPKRPISLLFHPKDRFPLLYERRVFLWNTFKPKWCKIKKQLQSAPVSSPGIGSRTPMDTQICRCLSPLSEVFAYNLYTPPHTLNHLSITHYIWCNVNIVDPGTTWVWTA